jgi:DNA (cytosine-5)-methyltransferase 1
VEVEPHAFATYKTNHPEVTVFKQDIRTIKGKEIISFHPGRELDLIAGCPPCQGFSSLTAKYRREDHRNGLIREMLRIIGEVMPRAVMLENVPGLALKGHPLLDEFLEGLNAYGYVHSWDILQVADYGVPQKRRRLVLLAGLGFKIDLPKPTHSNGGINGLAPWRTLRDVLKNMPQPVTLEEAMKKGGPQRFNWHIVRNMQSINQERIRRVKAGGIRTQLPNELRPNCHKRAEKGFSNVYGRMCWDHPSVTITAGFTTFSKGRFGHPEEDRTISVREGGLLQTFPPDYFFDTEFMEHVCDIIGNALPCDFAEALARKVYKAIAKNYASMAKTK